MKARASGTNSEGSRLARDARRPVALAEPLGHAGHHLDRLDDELLRADQRAEQHEQADEAELEIGGADLAIDRRRHLGLVDADDQARLRAGNARKADRCAFEPSTAVNESNPSGASDVSAFSAIADNSGMLSSGRPTHAGLVGRRCQHRAGAVDQDGRDAGRPARLLMMLRHPVETDGGENHRSPPRRLMADTG